MTTMRDTELASLRKRQRSRGRRLVQVDRDPGDGASFREGADNARDETSGQEDDRGAGDGEDRGQGSVERVLDRGPLERDRPRRHRAGEHDRGVAALEEYMTLARAYEGDTWFEAGAWGEELADSYLALGRVDDAVRTIGDATRRGYAEGAEMLCELAEKLMRSARLGDDLVLERLPTALNQTQQEGASVPPRLPPSDRRERSLDSNIALTGPWQSRAYIATM